MITPEMVDRLIEEDPTLRKAEKGASEEERLREALKIVPEETQKLLSAAMKSRKLQEVASDVTAGLLKKVGVSREQMFVFCLGLMAGDELLGVVLTPWLVGINIGYKLAQAELVEETLKRV